jgi:hypothetical protein
VLIAQHFSLSSVEAHLHALIPYFHDSRYIRIHTKRLLLL